MASRPEPPGAGAPVRTDNAHQHGPERGTDTPPLPHPPRAKRRRDGEAQPARLNPLGGKAPPGNDAAAPRPPDQVGGTATEALRAAMTEVRRRQEERKTVLEMVARSLDNVVTACQGGQKAVAEEITKHF